jgi:hypothetical protein
MRVDAEHAINSVGRLLHIDDDPSLAITTETDCRAVRRGGAIVTDLRNLNTNCVVVLVREKDSFFFGQR